MSEISPIVKVARDLREIEELYEMLLVQAIHKAGDRLMPGGEAMVALSPVGSPGDWAENVAAVELHHLATCPSLDHTRCRYAEAADDEDGAEPPLQTLLFWSEQWRTEAGYSLGRRPNIATETNFLRGSLEWAWDNEMHWDEFAADVRRARVRMENLLHAGDRVVRTQVPCDRPTCEDHPLLFLTYGDATDGSEDGFKCPSCKARFTQDDFQRAYAKRLRSDGALKFVPLADAVGTLRAQGRSERTIRKWLEPNPAEPESVVEAYCDLVTRKAFVWWPDIWHRHLVTPTRSREVAA